MKRNHWTAAVLAVVLFVSGGALGALADHTLSARVVNAKSAEDFRHHYVTEMQTRLKLTPAQTTQLEAILDDTKAKVKALRDSYHPQMLQIKNEQIGRVKAILTPGQVPEYEQLVAERERRARDQEAADDRRSRRHRAE